MAALTAAPKAAMPATFSVPARRPSSCPPPTQQRLQPLDVLGQHQRADALGAADLVRRKRHQIGLHRSDIKRYFPKRLDRVDMQQPAGRMHDVGDFGDRLDARRSRYWPASPTPAPAARRQAPSRRWSRSTTPAPVTLDGPDRLRRKAPAAQHRGMLDGRDQQPADRVARAPAQSRRQRQRIRLRAAGR